MSQLIEVNNQSTSIIYHQFLLQIITALVRRRLMYTRGIKHLYKFPWYVILYPDLTRSDTVVVFRRDANVVNKVLWHKSTMFVCSGSETTIFNRIWTRI